MTAYTTFSLLLALFAVLIPSVTLAEPSSAYSFQHEFTQECRSVQNALRLVSNATAESAMSMPDNVIVLFIQDRLDVLGNEIDSMSICRDGFYPRFWQFKSKFARERAEISRIGSEVSKFENRLILIEAQWQREKNRLAIAEENLRNVQDQLAKVIEAHERTLFLAKFLGAAVIILLFIVFYYNKRIEQLKMLFEKKQEKNDQRKNSFQIQMDDQERRELISEEEEEEEDKKEAEDDCKEEIGDSSLISDEAEIQLENNAEIGRGILRLSEVDEDKEEADEDYMEEFGDSSQLDPRVRDALKEIEQGNQTEIDLKCTDMGFQEAKIVAKALRHNLTVTEMNLFGNCLKAEGAKAISQALKFNTTLHTIILRCNFIGDEGARYIAQALRVNSSLMEINLKFNSIKAEGAREIAEAIKINSTLQRLGLSANDIGNEGARHIAQAMKFNSTLQVLCLKRCRIEAEGAREIAQALTVNSTLQKINLSCNYMGYEGVEGIGEIADALKVNTTLQIIDLSWNYIEADGVEKISQALKVNSTLLEIHLEGYDTNIGKELTKNNCEKFKSDNRMRFFEWMLNVSKSHRMNYFDPLILHCMLFPMAGCKRIESN
jgi:hypothetical protein